MKPIATVLGILFWSAAGITSFAAWKYGYDFGPEWLFRAEAGMDAPSVFCFFGAVASTFASAFFAIRGICSLI